MGCRLQGFYFGIVQPQRDNLDIISAFGKMNNYKIESSVLKHYLLIENMLMEKENGTFIGFQDGEMLFEDNVPSDKINSIQKGILEYVKDARELLGDDGGDFAFCNEIVSYMFNGKIDKIGRAHV